MSHLIGLERALRSQWEGKEHRVGGGAGAPAGPRAWVCHTTDRKLLGLLLPPSPNQQFPLAAPSGFDLTQGTWGSWCGELKNHRNHPIHTLPLFSNPFLFPLSLFLPSPCPSGFVFHPGICWVCLNHTETPRNCAQNRIPGNAQGHVGLGAPWSTGRCLLGWN